MNIFISYSSKDRAVVAALVDDLIALGHDVWFDQKLVGGHEWWGDILDRILKCDLFIFALTPQSLDSEPCKRECNYANDLCKRILPVLLADTNTSLLPAMLSAIHFIDYRQRDTRAGINLSRALNNLPPSTPLPDPLPKFPEIPVSMIGRIAAQIDAATLNYQEQSALIVDIKGLLNQPETVNEAYELLKRLRKRDDLFAKIEREIAAVLDATYLTSTTKDKDKPPTPPPVHEAAKSEPSAHPSLNLGVTDYELAGLGPRFFAFVIDVIALIALGFGTYVLAYTIVPAGVYYSSYANRYYPDYGAKNIGAIIAVAGVIPLYFLFCWTRRKGRTIGKTLTGITIVKLNGRPMGFGTAFVRLLLYFVNMLLFGWVTAIFDSKHRGWHDKVAGTIVVKQQHN